MSFIRAGSSKSNGHVVAHARYILVDVSLVETNVAFRIKDVPLRVQFLKTTLAFCSKGYVLVCAVVENAGAFCNGIIPPISRLLKMNWHFVARAIWEK